jgi:hypothetical protein
MMMLAVGVGLLLRGERPRTASSVCGEPDVSHSRRFVDSHPAPKSSLASASEDPARIESERSAAPTHSSVLRGRLVYRSTAQGVPFGAIDVESDDVIVTTLTTDREGRFESDRTLEFGPFALWPHDGFHGFRGFDEPILVSHAGEPLEVACDYPPTLVLRDPFPQGVGADDLAVQFERDESSPCSPHGADVREIDGLRFTRAPREWEAPDSPKVLWLQATSSPWRGTASVLEARGVVEAAVQWSQTAALEFQLYAPASDEFERTVEVTLTYPGSDKALRSVRRGLPTPNNEPIPFSCLDPGLYEITVESSRCKRLTLPVRALGGKTSRVAATLEREPHAGSIVVEVSSESGGPVLYPSSERGAGSVKWERWAAQPPPTLWSRDGGLPGIDSSVQESDAGRPWVLRYEYFEVPVGEVELFVRHPRFAVEPCEGQRARGGDTLRFRVLDRPESVDLGFRVFDAASGAELESFDIEYGIDGWLERRNSLASGAIVFRDVPDNGASWWQVTSHGYTCEFGEARLAGASMRADGRQRWMHIVLEPGWRASVATTSRGEPKSVAHVEIHADGVRVGATDDEGWLELELRVQPRSIEAFAHGWRAARHVLGDSADAGMCPVLELELERNR